ncbi:hypothetical protein Zmor_026817 [Zophobas morio]|uniref:Uncharacterized protein n=1 Tax=Zophobas morio TaxID=2755281 RepID=A0AA38HV63_9CUCU|nr:hypothetical protein Zmor_026817 [Zophobas morio]
MNTSNTNDSLITKGDELINDKYERYERCLRNEQNSFSHSKLAPIFDHGNSKISDKTKKLQGEQSLRRCSNSVNPKGSTCHMHLGCQGKANQKIYLRIDCSFSDCSNALYLLQLTNALQAIAPFRGPNRSDECDSKRIAKEKVAKTNCKRGKH